MPLIELKTIKPVCDKCGKVGTIWTTIEPGQEFVAIPPGWTSVRLPGQGTMDFMKHHLRCDECESTPDIREEGR